MDLYCGDIATALSQTSCSLHDKETEVVEINYSADMKKRLSLIF